MAIPAESLTSLDNQGIKETGKLHINLSTEELIQAALERKEGELASTGAFCATTVPEAAVEKAKAEGSGIFGTWKWGCDDPQAFFEGKHCSCHDYSRRKDIVLQSTSCWVYCFVSLPPFPFP